MAAGSEPLRRMEGRFDACLGLQAGGQWPISCLPQNRSSPILRMVRRRAASGKSPLRAKRCERVDKAGNPERPAPEEHPPGLLPPQRFCPPKPQQRVWRGSSSSWVQIAGWPVPSRDQEWWLAICVSCSRISEAVVPPYLKLIKTLIIQQVRRIAVFGFAFADRVLRRRGRLRSTVSFRNRRDRVTAVIG
jgi:hypothetical protein